MEHTYEINAFGDTVCNACDKQVATRNKKTGKFSINDITRHEEGKESHPITRKEDRKPIVDELERDWEDLTDLIIVKRKNSDREAMDMLKKKFLGKLREYNVCAGCKKMVFDPRLHRIPAASLSFDESEENPPVLCRSLRRHLAAAARRAAGEMTSNNDHDLNGNQRGTRKYFDFDSFEKGTEWGKDDFVWVKNLGEGGQGIVDLYREKSENGLLALKSVVSNDMVEREIMIQRQFNHKNIVRLYDFFEDGDKKVLMLEYCSSRSLHDVLEDLEKEDSNLTEESVVRMLLEIVEAVTECHSKGVMHCDIKPENILIGKNREMKLADFELSLFKMTDRPLNYPGGGTKEYMSPEMLNAYLTDDYAFNETTDVWSLGALLFVLLTHKFPFSGDTEKELYSSVINDLGEDGTFEFPSNVPEGAQDLVMAMLQIDPKARIALEEVKNHCWIQEVLKRPSYMSSSER
jgi:Protein kinase domain